MFNKKQPKSSEDFLSIVIKKNVSSDVFTKQDYWLLQAHYVSAPSRDDIHKEIIAREVSKKEKYSQPFYLYEHLQAAAKELKAEILERFESPDAEKYYYWTEIGLDD